MGIYRPFEGTTNSTGSQGITSRRVYFDEWNLILTWKIMRCDYMRGWGHSNVVLCFSYIHFTTSGWHLYRVPVSISSKHQRLAYKKIVKQKMSFATTKKRGRDMFPIFTRAWATGSNNLSWRLHFADFQANNFMPFLFFDKNRVF